MRLQDTTDKSAEEFAIVFAAMGVNMETAHYFKQVCPLLPELLEQTPQPSLTRADCRGPCGFLVQPIFGHFFQSRQRTPRWQGSSMACRPQVLPRELVQACKHLPHCRRHMRHLGLREPLLGTSAAGL